MIQNPKHDRYHIPGNVPSRFVVRLQTFRGDVHSALGGEPVNLGPIHLYVKPDKATRFQELVAWHT